MAGWQEETLGAGEQLLDLPGFLPYPEIFQNWLPGQPADWYDDKGAMLFPFRVFAMVPGLILMPLVSRLTARWDPPWSLDASSAEDNASAKR